MVFKETGITEVKTILQWLVVLYQKILSPFMGGQCRFTPTCSCYMHEALEKHGAIKGLILGLIRIIKCNPWINAKWVDPVPSSFAWRDLFHYKRPE